jgi:parallel beta-helix repeat protein
MTRTLYPSVLLTLTLAACGGGGGDGTGAPLKSTTVSSSQVPSVATASTSTSSDASAVVKMDVAVPDPSASNVQPVPANIANGSTVSLQCGQVYQGTLDLNGKSNVTVNTVGNCGKASITPGSAISGWTPYQGDIYSAPIEFAPVQVSIAGQPVARAQWPNNPQVWADSGSPVPNGDLDGATLVYLENQSVVQTRAISGGDIDTSKPFYVEGKLWMLDSPGEWVISDGRLYMWAPDGQSPEGRVWAAADGNGINANHSSDITIDGIRVFSATDGVSGESSTNLKVINSEIVNSARDGIWANDSKGLVVDKTAVANSSRSGIDGWYWIEGAVISNTSVTNVGTVGKPTPTDAGIMFGNGRDNRIDNVRVINTGYHGISVLHNWHTSVTNSVVDSACSRLTDCAGIYTGARDQLPLNLRIEGNTVNNVRGHEGIGIYLDDFSNGVTVTGNTVSNSRRGMVLHNGFDNVITHNTFVSNEVSHIGFGQTNIGGQGNIRNNQVTNNTFRSTNNEWTFNLETGTNLRSFGIFDHNTYISTNTNEFGRSWEGGGAPGITTSYGAWKEWMGQDANSTMNGVQ